MTTFVWAVIAVLAVWWLFHKGTDHGLDHQMKQTLTPEAYEAWKRRRP